MRLIEAVHECAFAAVLIGAVTIFGVMPAQATIATDTAGALADYPGGGEELELAIAGILDGYQGQPRIIVQEILQAAASATDEQMIAIGSALAAKARSLAETNPAESRALVAAVLASRHSGLMRHFQVAGGHGPSPLAIPGGSHPGRFDSTSPD